MQVLVLNVTCGWPSGRGDGCAWADLDGEGGLFSPGFQQVFALDGLPFAPEVEEDVRQYVVRRLNQLHADAQAFAGLAEPVVWTMAHYDNWDDGCPPGRPYINVEYATHDVVSWGQR